MFRKLLITSTLFVSIVLSSGVGYSQFGGVQVQVGGYGTGVRVGNFGYGNGYYGGYGNGNGSSYYRNNSNFGYGNRFGSSYNGYYNNGIGYNSFSNPAYRYASPRDYSAPFRSFPVRRYRYR
jgi:hypothetical protein